MFRSAMTAGRAIYMRNNSRNKGRAEDGEETISSPAHSPGASIVSI